MTQTMQDLVELTERLMATAKEVNAASRAHLAVTLATLRDYKARAAYNAEGDRIEALRKREAALRAEKSALMAALGVSGAELLAALVAHRVRQAQAEEGGRA